jgi:hypothetical protein
VSGVEVIGYDLIGFTKEEQMERMAIDDMVQEDGWVEESASKLKWTREPGDGERGERGWGRDRAYLEEEDVHIFENTAKVRFSVVMDLIAHHLRQCAVRRGQRQEADRLTDPFLLHSPARISVSQTKTLSGRSSIAATVKSLELCSTKR